MDTQLSATKQFEYLLHGIPWAEEQVQVDLFVEVMNSLTAEKPCLIELGSSGTDGSAYSLLFEKRFNYNCEIINTEPREYLLKWVREAWKGKHLVNAKLYHGCSGVIRDVCGVHQGVEFDLSNIPVLRVKTLIEENAIDIVDILHCDIQGAEVDVLKELAEDGIVDRVRYFFISLHNTQEACLEIFREKYNVQFLFNNPVEGGCGDGLIVAKNLNF
jgi:FkbM family methyltransferase